MATDLCKSIFVAYCKAELSKRIHPSCGAADGMATFPLLLHLLLSKANKIMESKLNGRDWAISRASQVSLLTE